IPISRPIGRASKTFRSTTRPISFSTRRGWRSEVGGRQYGGLCPPPFWADGTDAALRPNTRTLCPIPYVESSQQWPMQASRQPDTSLPPALSHRARGEEDSVARREQGG